MKNIIIILALSILISGCSRSTEQAFELGRPLAPGGILTATQTHYDMLK